MQLMKFFRRKKKKSTYPRHPGAKINVCMTNIHNTSLCWDNGWIAIPWSRVIELPAMAKVRALADRIYLIFDEEDLFVPFVSKVGESISLRYGQVTFLLTPTTDYSDDYIRAEAVRLKEEAVDSVQ